MGLKGSFLFCIVVKTTVASSFVIQYVIMPSVYLINTKYRHVSSLSIATFLFFYLKIPLGLYKYFHICVLPLFIMCESTACFLFSLSHRCFRLLSRFSNLKFLLPAINEEAKSSKPKL